MNPTSARHPWITCAVLIASLGGARIAAAEIEVPIFVIDDDGTHGAPLDEDLDELVVQSAAKRTESVFETASIVTVITGEQLRAAGHRTLDDVLDTVPGFEARRARFFWEYGPRPWGRGAGRVILYLINGIPVNLARPDIANGWALPLVGVKRLEIISGPGGVVWGANAYLGVVNMIVEPELEGATAEVSFSGGTGRGLRSAAVTTVAGAERFTDGQIRAAFWFQHVTSEGFELELPYDVQDGPSAMPRPDGAYELAPSSGPTLGGVRQHDTQVRVALDVFGLRVDALVPLYTRNTTQLSERGLRADVFANTVTGERYETGLASSTVSQPTVLSLRYGAPLGDASRLDVRVFYAGYRQLETDYVNFPPNGPSAGAGGKYPLGVISSDFTVGGIGPLDDAEYAIGAGVDLKHDRAWNSLLVGLEAFVDGNVELQYTVRGQSTLGPIRSTNAARRETIAVYANDRLRLGAVELEGGARLQASGQYGIEPILSLAGLYRLPGEIFLKVNCAQGFRPPATRMANRNDDPVTNPVAHLYGNPDLAPERSQSLEGELSGLFLRGVGQIRYLRLAVGFQWTELSNLIVDRGERPMNSGERTIYSVESRAELRFASARASVGYHWLHAVDGDQGEVRNVANHKLVLAVDARLSPRVRLSLGCVLYSAREDLNRLASAVSPATRELAASPSAVVVDRLAPAAELDGALTIGGFWGGRLDLRLFAYNALDARTFTPAEDFEKRTALLSAPAPRLAVLGGVVLRW